jgi:hypothetical protein
VIKITFEVEGAHTVFKLSHTDYDGNDHFKEYRIDNTDEFRAVIRHYEEYIRTWAPEPVEVEEPQIWDFRNPTQYALAMEFYERHKPVPLPGSGLTLAQLERTRDLLQQMEPEGDCYLTINTEQAQRFREEMEAAWRVTDGSLRRDYEQAMFDMAAYGTSVVNLDGVSGKKSKFKEYNW